MTKKPPQKLMNFDRLPQSSLTKEVKTRKKENEEENRWAGTNVMHVLLPILAKCHRGLMDESVDNGRFA